jgi:hypothetical protein
MGFGTAIEIDTQGGGWSNVAMPIVSELGRHPIKPYADCRD